MGQWRDRLRALTARATNKIGQTQTQELIQNPAGYYHNLVQTLCDGSRFFALVLIPSSTRAEEQVVRLKQAPGLNAVEGQCGACHSLDYIVTNLPFLDAGKWDAEVAKMIKAFGAPAITWRMGNGFEQ